MTLRRRHSAEAAEPGISELMANAEARLAPWPHRAAGKPIFEMMFALRARFGSSSCHRRAGGTRAEGRWGRHDCCVETSHVNSLEGHRGAACGNAGGRDRRDVLVAVSRTGRFRRHDRCPVPDGRYVDAPSRRQRSRESRSESLARTTPPLTSAPRASVSRTPSRRIGGRDERRGNSRVPRRGGRRVGASGSKRMARPTLRRGGMLIASLERHAESELAKEIS